MTWTESIRLRPARARVIIFAATLVAVAMACSVDQPERVEISLNDAWVAHESESPPIFLDVRTETEYRQAHIEGALHVPHTEVAVRIEEIRAGGSSEVIVFCERGGRARDAEAALAEAGGFEVLHLSGDMRAWRRANLPVVREGG